MSDTAPSEPIRPRARTDQAADPIPIPEADARSRKARTVRIQDILSAHARALDVRLEEGMREMRLAMEAAIRRTGIHEAPHAAPTFVAAPPPPQPVVSQPVPQIREDVAKGLAAQTEERFQALTIRLQKIEDALRTVALGGGSDEIERKLDALADSVTRSAQSEDQLVERVIEAQREGLDDLMRRVGSGVSAVISALQNELNATVRRLELTSDASGGAAAEEASRLERTMMAIAEHQEAVLDERLTELRQSMTGAEPVPMPTSGEALPVTETPG